MASPRVDDLRLHVTLTSLQSHARGWSFCINRVEPGGDDATTTSIWGATPDGQVTRLVADGSGAA